MHSCAMKTETVVNGTRLELRQGNIVEAGTEAIVNAANTQLAGGGGVDGAIHRAAGPELYDLTAKHGHCPTGSAVITGAARMQPPTRYIIHAVGPVYSASRDEQCAEKLASAYTACMRLARENKIRSVAFPSLSTGAYGYPINKAAEIALRTVIDQLTRSPKAENPEQVVFILFSVPDLQAYGTALEKVTSRK